MRSGYQELLYRRRNAKRQASDSADRLMGWGTYMAKNSGTIVRDLIEERMFPPGSIPGRLFRLVFNRGKSDSFATRIRRVGRTNKSRLGIPYRAPGERSSSGLLKQTFSLLRPVLVTAAMAYAKHRLGNIFSCRKRR